jgi:hypothetical protein
MTDVSFSNYPLRISMQIIAFRHRSASWMSCFLINTMNTHTRLSHRRTYLDEDEHLLPATFRSSATSVATTIYRYRLSEDNLNQCLSCVLEIVVMTGVEDLQQVIAVFLQQEVLELIDAHLCSALGIDNDAYLIDRLYQIVKSQGSALFQVNSNEDWTFSVRVEPTVGAEAYHSHV